MPGGMPRPVCRRMPGSHDGRRQPGVPRDLARIGRKVHPERPARAHAVRIRSRRADHRDADARRRPRAAAGRRIGFRSRRRHVRPVLRDPGGPAQRAARPPGILARQEGESARVDDDRAGRDAVRLHLRDEGPARWHQGAARAPADPGAQGGDARRRVLRQEEPSVAASRQRARRRRARLVAGDGNRRSALQPHRRDRSPDPRRVHRQPRDIRRGARKAREVPRRRREGRRSEHPVDGRGDQPDRPQGDGGRGRKGRGRAAHRDVSGAEFPRDVPPPRNGRRRSRKSI